MASGGAAARRGEIGVNLRSWLHIRGGVPLNRGMGSDLRNPDELHRFYERNALRLRSWLRRETGSTDLANDLTAETFAQALVSLRRFRGSTEAEAVAWLYGIAHNLLRQYRRRQRVETSARRRLGMPVRDYAEYDEAEELADAQLLAPALEEALAGLPEHEREALDLRVVGGLRFDEIAERLAVASPAARMRVTRALRALRARLEGAA
jgi:RNA polymerase sigma factor (sigma-70 family)